MGIFAAVYVIAVSFGTLTTLYASRLYAPQVAEVGLKPTEPTQVDGFVTYTTKNGTTEGDVGAFVFFFPAERPFDSPLTIYGAEPTRPLPLKFDNFRETLASKGGYFEIAGFDGIFGLNVEPGEYDVLIVSYRIEDDLKRVDAKTLREIGRRIFHSEDLLERNKFVWSREKIEGERTSLHYNMGRLRSSQ